MGTGEEEVMTRLKRIVAFSLLSILLLSFSLPLQVTAAEEELVKEETITGESSDACKETAKELFSETIEEGGRTYELSDISCETIDMEYLDTLEITVETDSEPSETMTQDGIVYDLASVSETEGIQAEPQIVTAYDDYDHYVSTTDVPQTKEVSTTDEATGAETTISCNLVDIEPAGTRTVNSTMTVTFSNYDAAYYAWNGNYIARNDQTPPLAGYEDELLAYCNADPGSEITGYSWSGEPYTSDGVLCRDAVASVRQRVQMYRANYEGTIQPPAQTVYSATYTAPDQAGDVEYTVRATATYIPVSNYVPYILTGAGILVLAVLIVAILVVLSKKKEKEEKKEI